MPTGLRAFAPPARRAIRLRGPFDLRRGDRDTITLLQDLIRRNRLTVHPDQVVVRLARLHLLVEQVLDGRAIRDLNVVRESAAVVVDEQDTHEMSFRL